MSNNPKISEYDYTVRADGRRTDLLERFFTSGGVTENSYSWSYDALNRLTSETIDSSNDALDRTTSWTFDLTGNRLNQIVDVGNNGSLDAVTSYTYDANDRLVREETDKTGTADDTAGWPRRGFARLGDAGTGGSCYWMVCSVYLLLLCNPDPQSRVWATPAGLLHRSS